jgi:plasmid stabilization system protein ParE
MSRRFIVRPLAEVDLEHAARWYDEEQTGLGSRFLSAVDQVFERIRERPQQFPVVSGDIRRALLPTFPYAAYFRTTQDMARQSSIVGAFGISCWSSNAASLRW